MTLDLVHSAYVVPVEVLGLVGWKVKIVFVNLSNNVRDFSGELLRFTSSRLIYVLVRLCIVVWNSVYEV